jgi:septal ring factor EnvC (AmiA/AmiB activator)
MVPMARSYAVVIAVLVISAEMGGHAPAMAQQRSPIGQASPPRAAPPQAPLPSPVESAAAPPPKLSPEDARRQLGESQLELKRIELEKVGLSRDVRVMAIDRAHARQRLIEAAQKVRAGEERLTAIESELEQLRVQETGIHANLEKRYAAIADMLALMQRMGREPPPVIVTSRHDALKMVRSAMMLASFFPEMKIQADRLTAELESLRTVVRDSEDQKEKFKNERANLDKLREETSALMIKRREQLTVGRDQLDMLHVAAQRHTQMVNNLGELLGKLDRDAKDAALNQVDMAAYEAELKSGHIVELKPEVKKVAFVQPARMKPAVPFAEAKGMLPLPANGTRLRGYGAIDSVGGKTDGVSIETREQAQITAPSDGWVLYAGPFRSYGQLLIINAGGGYHVLLAGMDQINVTVGQFVLAGEPVASMGASRSAKEDGNPAARPVLYVEFRKDQRPIDPDPWWSTGVEKG